MGLHLDIWIDALQHISRRVEPRIANSVCGMNDLSLQIAVVDDIKVNDANPADSSSCQIHRHRSAQATGSNTKDTRRFQFSLTFHPHFGNDQMSTVAFNFFTGEWFSHLANIRSTPRYRRYDADCVAVLHGCLLSLKVTDILVIYINVDEVPDPSILSV